MLELNVLIWQSDYRKKYKLNPCFERLIQITDDLFILSVDTGDDTSVDFCVLTGYVFLKQAGDHDVY